MELEIYRNYKDEVFIRPVHKKDVNLFRHCAFGHATFPNIFFREDVEPILEAHGVISLKITDNS